MESSQYRFDIQMSGPQTSEYTLLFSDLFNLFPNSFHDVIARYESRYRILLHTDDGFNSIDGQQTLRYSSLYGYANDLIAYLEEHNIRNIVYVAHSINAFLAFTVADKAPHLFKKIILTSACPSLIHDPQSHYICGFDADHLAELFDKLICKDGNVLQNLLPHNHTVQLTDILSRAFLKMTIENAHAIFDILTSTDCRRILGTLQVPTIILQVSADSVATNEAGYLMYRTIPNSQFIRIKAKGQLPQEEAPEQIIQAMNLFINAEAC